MSKEKEQKILLIIDDDKAVLNSIVRQLSRLENAELIPESNPLNALSLIESKKIDLVVCDIKMEPINGLEVLKRIKEAHPDLPVIIATGFVDDKVMEKAVTLGCNTFFIKPVRRKELIDAVLKLLS